MQKVMSNMFSKYTKSGNNNNLYNYSQLVFTELLERIINHHLRNKVCCYKLQYMVQIDKCKYMRQLGTDTITQLPGIYSLKLIFEVTRFSAHIMTLICGYEVLWYIKQLIRRIIPIFEVFPMSPQSKFLLEFLTYILSQSLITISSKFTEKMSNCFHNFQYYVGIKMLF